MNGHAAGLRESAQPPIADKSSHCSEPTWWAYRDQSAVQQNASIRFVGLSARAFPPPWSIRGKSDLLRREGPGRQALSCFYFKHDFPAGARPRRPPHRSRLCFWVVGDKGRAELSLAIVAHKLRALNPDFATAWSCQYRPQPSQRRCFDQKIAAVGKNDGERENRDDLKGGIKIGDDDRMRRCKHGTKPAGRNLTASAAFPLVLHPGVRGR